ncbi:MAG: hypothetical protein Q8Q03_00645, partial [bacterium]|nr:hypothetical protein [bacterium]
ALDFRYGPPGIRAIANSDVQLTRLFKEKNQEKYQLIGRAYRFWERFFEENEIDFILTRETATFATRSAYNVARHLGIPFAQLAIGGSDLHLSFDDVNENHIWQGLLELLAAGPRELSPDEKAETLDFIKLRLPRSGETMPLRFVPFSFFKTLKNYLGMHFHDRKKLRRLDPVRVAALRYGRYRLKKRMIWKYLTQPFFRYDSPKNEKFVYFPFFSGEETSYLVNDHYYARHESSLIKEIADSLPVGYMLYVKEHPTNPGDFTLGELRQLKKIANIRILHPSHSSQQLIEKSKAVCVLQGTTGWEAFLSKKPVITLSKPFFAYSSLVYVITDIRDLSAIFWKALNRGPEIYQERETEWFWFIHAVLRSCGEGRIVRLKAPYNFATDEANVTKVADFLKKRIR